MTNNQSSDSKPSTDGPISVFQYLPRLTLSELLAEAGREVKSIAVRKNRDILIAGDHYRLAYVNNEGWLLRYKILHNGSRQIIDFVLPGAIFGLQACLFQKSLYSVATLTDASLSAIPLEVVDRLFERSPNVAQAPFRAAACESAILAEHLIDAARRSAYERVGHLLLELFVRLKSADLTDNMSFELPLTQELIADALGLTTVHVNRTMLRATRRQADCDERKGRHRARFRCLVSALRFREFLLGRNRLRSRKRISIVEQRWTTASGDAATRSFRAGIGVVESLRRVCVHSSRRAAPLEVACSVRLEWRSPICFSPSLCRPRDGARRHRPGRNPSARTAGEFRFRRPGPLRRAVWR